MIVIGLSGKASSGKDTVADYLVARYGFVKFGFSDGVRREVTVAYSLSDDSMLTDRHSKEEPNALLMLTLCSDLDFVQVARAKLVKENPDTFFDLDQIPLSPRWVQQTWGSEYRRAQDPDYWVKQAQDWVHAAHYFRPHPELRPQYFVNTSVRFPNEREWIHLFGGGNVWHLHRDGIQPVHAHESETPLPVLNGERQIWNNAGLEQLYRGVDLLLSTNAAFVRCEPMLRVNEPEEQV